MFGAFLSGGLGSLLRLAGMVAVLLSLVGFVAHGPAAGSWLMLGLVLIVVGSFLKFRAGHSVRVVETIGPAQPARSRSVLDRLIEEREPPPV